MPSIINEKFLLPLWYLKAFSKPLSIKPEPKNIYNSIQIQLTIININLNPNIQIVINRIFKRNTTKNGIFLATSTVLWDNQ